MSTFCVDNMKKIIVIGAKLGNVGGKVFEDGKINAADLASVPEFFMIFPGLIEIQWNQVVPEAKDLQPEEVTELINAFCEAFDIPQDKVEVTIEGVLAVVAQVVACIFNLIEIFKKKPAPVEPEPAV